MNPPPLLRAEDLRVRHAGAPADTLRGVGIELRRSEVVAVVGESGAGKSTLVRALSGLCPLDGGRVDLEGNPLFDADGGGPTGAALRGIRRRLQVVFQQPGATLNPRMPVREALIEGPRAHGLAKGADLDRRAAALLATVGLDEEHLGRFPSELSGGQKQRVALARALSVEPDILLLDEPTSAVDQELRLKLVELLSELRRNRGLAMIFVSHDLELVRGFADRICVMYQGEFVESAPAADLYARPVHPYTKALIRAASGGSAWVEDLEEE